MVDSVTDFLNNYGGQLVNAGVTALAASDSASRAQGLQQQLGVLNDAAAGALTQGYDAALGATENLSPRVRALLNEYENDVNTNVNRFGDDSAAISGQYGSDLYSTLGDAEAQYISGAGEYAGGMEGTLDSSIPYLMAGHQGFENSMQPYVGTGENALNYLAQQMGMDPATLTPSQKRVLEKYHREITANLGASGLRGAGRAGVAAVNEGLADLHANFYDQNQNRALTAASALNQTGYNAAGAVGGARRDAGQQMTQLTYDTGEKLAENARRLGDIQGELSYSTGQNVSNNNLKQAERVRDVGFDTSQNVAKENLSTNSSLETGLAKARGDTALGVAQTQAQNLISKGTTAASTANTIDTGRGKTYQAIADIFAGNKPAVA